MQAAPDVRPLTGLFKALGDDTRLRIVALLSHGELCVCHVEEALDLPQATASRQLSILKTAGIVEARREGTWMHYRLSPSLEGASRQLLRVLVKELGSDGRLRKNIERLLKARKPGACK
jgi:ArsR family transcriptional regulator